MEIVNIVTSGTLGQRVDLLKIYQTIPDVFSYDPEGYHGGYLRLSKYTATVYSSGKYIIPGVKAFDDLKSNHLELLKNLDGIIDTKLIEEAKVRNIVACSDIGHELDLNSLFMELISNTEYEITYEPEVFPGLCIKTDIGSSNIYRNGKYLLLGTSTKEQLNRLDNLIRSHINI